MVHPRNISQERTCPWATGPHSNRYRGRSLNLRDSWDSCHLARESAISSCWPVSASQILCLASAHFCFPFVLALEQKLITNAWTTMGVLSLVSLIPGSVACVTTLAPS